jgi:hypothetical protein
VDIPYKGERLQNGHTGIRTNRTRFPHILVHFQTRFELLPATATNIHPYDDQSQHS